MVEIINLTDELRIRRLDDKNVTVKRYIVGKDGKPRWEGINGCGRGPFLYCEADCAVWVLNKGLMDDGDETEVGLQEAVKRYERAAKRLESAVRKAVG